MHGLIDIKGRLKRIVAGALSPVVTPEEATLKETYAGRRKKGLAAVCSLAFVVFVCVAFIPNVSFGATKKNTRSLCLECHSGARALVSRRNVHKPVKMGLCTACHNPHASSHAKLIGYGQEELCYTCHDANRLIKGKVVHKPVSDGQCAECHDPHSSNYRGLMKQGGSSACFSCHDREKVIKGKIVHPEVAKGNCRTCHLPHASDREGLLTRDRNDLCTKCHKNPKQSSHSKIKTKGSDCIGCHSPHASDNIGLLRSFRHKPFADGRCSVCHSSTGKVKDKSTAMCVQCHESTLPSFNKRYTHLFPGPGENACTNCHTPHAADKKSLIKDKDSRVCYSCHMDTRHFVEQSEFKHSNINDCQDCHVSHGSNTRFFMRDEDGGCLNQGCHASQGAFTHPVGEGVIDPRLNTEMNCVSCHNPMGSPEDLILRGEREMGLCIQCHQM